MEVFLTLGKAGGCSSAYLEALARVISLGLKYSIPIKEFIDELKNIKCLQSCWCEGELVLSCPDAVAKVMSGFGKDAEVSSATV